MADVFRLRWSFADGPELRCGHCGEWWQITPEHWQVRLSRFHMCLACERERARLYAAMRQYDPQYRQAKNAKSRRYRKWLKETYPQYIRAYDRERKARERKRSQAYRDAAKEGTTDAQTT